MQSPRTRSSLTGSTRTQRMSEEWREIPGHPGYEVSDEGRVRSVDRVVIDVRGKPKRYTGKLLNPTVNRHGYLSLALGKKNPNKDVHRLVMLAFEGPCPPGKEVLHKNGDRKDPCLANLRYGTRSENHQDVAKHGRRRLNSEQVARIRKLRAARIPHREVARRFSVSPSLVLRIEHKKLYAHV